MDDDEKDCAGVCDGGVKRAAERMEVDVERGDGGGGEAVKRRRKEVEVKRVAEIVLVLAAMARMRGGGDPTVAERKMMAEARAKVVAMCEELAPKDVVSVEACAGVIEDLGLNRLKDRVGFRTPKQLISEKIAFTQRRMEESKVFASQPSSFPPQRVQTANGAANENRGTPPTVRALSSDKQSHLPSATGTFQPPTSAVSISSAATTPIRFHSPGTEVRPPVSPVVQNSIGRDANSVVGSKHDRAHLKPDGRPNGPSLPNVQVSSGARQRMTRTTPVHAQTQSLPQVNVGVKNMVPDQSSVRINSNVGSNSPQLISQTHAKTPGHVANQTHPGVHPTMHHPVHNMQSAHAPQAANRRSEISKLVQSLLAPKLPPRPVWTPPSRDYMNRAILCQFCKLVINEMENMVVCDACEKGFHLGCLQSYNAKGLPRGEWHCPRCMSMSHGKPFPPKYGRVTRNMNAPKASSNTIGAQLSLDKKAGSVDKANLHNAITNRNQDLKTHLLANQPNDTTNGSQDMKLPTQAVKVIEPSSKSIQRPGNDIAKNDVSSDVKEIKPKLEITNNTSGAVVETSSSTCTMPISASGKTSEEVKSEKPFQDTLMSETEAEPRTPVILQANSRLDDLTTSNNQTNVDRKVLDSVQNPVLQHSDSNGVSVSHVCNGEEKGDVQRNLGEIERVRDQAENVPEASQSGLHNVDWVGDVYRIVDEKKFFRSCRINGTVYQVQDYALFCSGNDKMIPSKLQAMWEDSQTTSKWLVVHKCYFPDDLPAEVGRPGAPESNEVYESTHGSNVLAGFIQGPCQVLPFRKFGEDSETTDQGSQAIETSHPVFIRNWFYDETRQAFCPGAS